MRGSVPQLDARLVVTQGGFHLDVALSVRAGEVVAVLGPNGAGKSTALRALAGLLPLQAGHIDLAGHRIDEPARGRLVPPHGRPIGVVFQDYLLFPHLNALDNVAFGPRCRGLSRRRARQQAADWLDRVGLREHALRRPRQLSGGQAQRVALARALAVRPALLLLDEPLAALDAHTRLETRAELRRHLADHDGATLLVTHDPMDAMVLADRLLIMEQGRVVQQGDPMSVTSQPRTEYVARLVGVNLHRGRADGHTVTLPEGIVFTAADQVCGDAFVAFQPSAVGLHPARLEGITGNTWPARVASVDRHGDKVRVCLTGPLAAMADISPVAAAQLDLRHGMRLWGTVAAADIRVYPVS